VSSSAAPANVPRWAGLIILAAAGLIAMAAVQTIHTNADSTLVELHGAEPAKLSPFFDAAGNRVAIESFRGKIVILNLWAPWCVPCLQEMPSLDRLAARLPEKHFAVVVVTKDPVGDSPSRAMFDRMGLKRLSLYLDPKGALEPEVGGRGFPTTLILSANGAPLAYREGAADWDSDAMVANLDRLAARGRGGNPGS
jgi:thiol-disulfide isomerase/thioredoxin